MDNSFCIALAKQTIRVHGGSSDCRIFCQDYLTDAPADFEVELLLADIQFEREKSAREDKLQGLPVRHFSVEYLETLALYRKIAEKMPEYDTMLFHGSAIAVDNRGYLFTAKSGTGKSTHTRLWRERFGSRAVMVNDDKPLLKITESGVMVYGTPWDGKHRLSSNLGVELKGLCLLSRSENNSIAPIDARDAWPMLMQQTYRPADPAALAKTLTLIEKLSQRVKLWKMGCNISPEAAEMAYMAMGKGNEEV